MKALSLTSKTAEKIADELGPLPVNSGDLEKEVTRLRQKKVVNLPQVANLHEFLDDRRQTRQCCRILGESRTGKTVACDSYRLRNRPQIQGGRPVAIPVMLIQPPQEATAKDLYSSILTTLRQRFTGGTVSQLRQRALETMRQCKVEMLMLIIDEADRIRPRVFADVRDIHDHLKIAIALVGTDRLDAVVKKDEQVYNRFRFKYTFGRLGGDAFRQTVAIWEQQVLQMPVASNLNQGKKLEILQGRTGGYIGILDMVLRDAAVAALRKGQALIDEDTLQEVAELCS